MGFLDRLLGREDTSRQQTWNQQQDWNPSGAPQRPRTDDEAAIERYRYMLRTRRRTRSSRRTPRRSPS